MPIRLAETHSCFKSQAFLHGWLLYGGQGIVIMQTATAHAWDVSVTSEE